MNAVRGPALDPAAGPERIADECIRIALPDPFVPGVTAAFLLGPATAPVLLDAGADTRESEAALRKALAGFGTSPEELPLLLSHTHLDHAGGLLRYAPRELVVHERAVAEMRERNPRSSRGPAALRRMGLGEAAIAALAPDGEPVGDAPLADLAVDVVLEGESGTVPGAPGWRWLLAEGHAPGHVVLFEETSRTLLAADQFLEKWKTPLLVSDPGFDSFGAYLASIDAALELEPLRICSSHTRTIDDAAAWLTRLRASLRRRLARAADAVKAEAGAGTDADEANAAAHEPVAGATAEQVLSRLYPDATRGPLRIVFLREVLAMLRHLAFTGRIEGESVRGVERFR